MKSKIFQDENHCYQFDFRDAIWVTDELHDTFQKNKASILRERLRKEVLSLGLCNRPE